MSSSVTSLALLQRLPVARRAAPAEPGVAIRFRPGGVAVLLCASLTGVLLAGVTVSVLTIGLGHDHLMGMAALFDLNGEHNLPAWFSSSLLLAAAALLAFAACGAGPLLRRRWRTLALVFLLLSLDEAASLHEMSNAPLRSLLVAGPLLYFPWIGLGLLFAGTVGWSQRALRSELPRSTGRAFMVAGALFMLGAVGMEALAAPIYAASGKQSIIHTVLVTVEETLEMGGVALFLLALLHYLGHAHAPLVISFDDRDRRRPGSMRLSPRRVALVLGLVVSLLAVISVWTQAVHYLTAADIPALVRLVNLSREGNVPTWYQASALLACATAAAVIAVAARRAARPFRHHWALVALAFLYLSADEAAGIHELSVRPLRSLLGASGILYYPWIIIGSLAVVVGAVASRTFIAALPRRTRRTVVAASAVFLSGALGVEALGGMFAELHGRDNLEYGLIATVEETLEMIGVVLMLRALLEHLRDHVGTLTLGALVPTSA